MKVLVFFASPRENGNTEKLLGSFLSGLPREAEVRVFSAYKINARPCTACGECGDKLCCVHNDLDFLDEYIVNADVVVFATPIYYCSVPSPLKAIFDRFQKYYAAKERGETIFAGNRKGAILLTLGRSGKMSIPLVEQQIKNAFDAISCEYIGTAYANFTDTLSVTQEQLEAARELAKRLLK